MKMDVLCFCIDIFRLLRINDGAQEIRGQTVENHRFLFNIENCID